MAAPIRIWIETSLNAALRCGGWAFVASEDGALTGAAGGERTGSAERMALAGLVEALKGLPAGAGVEIMSASRAVLAAPRRVLALAGGDEAPVADLDLWAPLSTALKGRAAKLSPVSNEPRTPTAFATAWAELARDKAKTSGTFQAAIPKTNLAKARV